MPDRLKIYTLYGEPGGRVSAHSREYNGRLMEIAAVSAKQAYYFAVNNVWSAGSSHPEGIVEFYNRETGEEGDHLLWCGCRASWGIGVGHNTCARELKRAMKQHEDECPNA